MKPIPLCTRTATTFTADGELDEEALRRHLQRMVDSRIGMWLGSGGSGEGFALSADELSRVYRIGKEVGGDKVLVGSNQPETHTPSHALEHAQLAIDAGVDIVSLYGPSSWHGFRPTDQEFLTYMDMVVGSIRHEVAVSPNGTLGYCPSARLIAEVCNKYSHVSTVNLTGISGDGYLIELLDALKRPVNIYHGFLGSANALPLGATGLHDAVAETNIVPKTFRSYADLLAAGDNAGAAEVYTRLQRFAHVVAPWRSASPRWLKMAMRVLHLPGGEGTVRPPYLLPGPDELDKLRRGLVGLRIPEINEYASAAGLV